MPALPPQQIFVQSAHTLVGSPFTSDYLLGKLVYDGAALAMQSGVWQRPVVMTGSKLRVIAPLLLDAQHPRQRELQCSAKGLNTFCCLRLMKVDLPMTPNNFLSDDFRYIFVQVRKLQGLIKAHSIFNAMMATPGKGEITALELEVGNLPEMSPITHISSRFMSPLGPANFVEKICCSSIQRKERERKTKGQVCSQG